jgi:hypothetical protein
MVGVPQPDNVRAAAITTYRLIDPRILGLELTEASFDGNCAFILVSRSDSTCARFSGGASHAQFYEAAWKVIGPNAMHETNSYGERVGGGGDRWPLRHGHVGRPDQGERRLSCPDAGRMCCDGEVRAGFFPPSADWRP